MVLGISRGMEGRIMNDLCDFKKRIPRYISPRRVVTVIFDIHINLQFTTSSRRLDGGASCVASVGGKCMVSKAKLVLYAFAV